MTLIFLFLLFLDGVTLMSIVSRRHTYSFVDVVVALPIAYVTRSSPDILESG